MINKKNFEIQETAAGRFTVTHTPTGLKCTFTKLQFNETRQFEPSPKFERLDANAQARILRELGEYLTTAHPDKVFTLPQVVENFANAARSLTDYTEGRQLLSDLCGIDFVNALDYSAVKLFDWLDIVAPEN